MAFLPDIDDLGLEPLFMIEAFPSDSFATRSYDSDNNPDLRPLIWEELAARLSAIRDMRQGKRNFQSKQRDSFAQLSCEHTVDAEMVGRLDVNPNKITASVNSTGLSDVKNKTLDRNYYTADFFGKDTVILESNND